MRTPIDYRRDAGLRSSGLLPVVDEKSVRQYARHAGHPLHKWSEVHSDGTVSRLMERWVGFGDNCYIQVCHQ